MPNSDVKVGVGGDTKQLKAEIVKALKDNPLTISAASITGMRSKITNAFKDKPIKLAFEVNKSSVKSAVVSITREFKKTPIPIRIVVDATNVATQKRRIQSFLGNFTLNFSKGSFGAFLNKVRSISTISFNFSKGAANNFLTRANAYFATHPVKIRTTFVGPGGAGGFGAGAPPGGGGGGGGGASAAGGGSGRGRSSRATFNPITSGLSAVTSATNQASIATATFAERIGFSTTRLAAYLIPAAAVFQIGRGFAVATKSVIEINREINKLTQILGGNAEKANDIADSIFRTAEKFGQSGIELLKSANVIAQAGDLFSSASTIKDVADLLAQTQLGPTFGSPEDTIKGIIAALNQFNLTGSDTANILDTSNELSKKFAVEAGDIFAAVTRGGSSLAAAGGSFQEFAAIVTAIRSTTRLPAEVIGTGLQTLIPKILRPDNLKFIEEITGGRVRDAKGNLKDISQIFLELGRVVAGLPNPEEDIFELLPQIADVRQTKLLAPLLLSIANGNTTLIDSLKTADQSRGSVARDADIALGRADVQIGKLVAKFQTFFKELAQDKGIIPNLVKDISAMAGSFADLLRFLGPVVPLLVKLGTLKLATSLLAGIPGFVRGTNVFAAGPLATARKAGPGGGLGLGASPGGGGGGRSGGSSSSGPGTHLFSPITPIGTAAFTAAHGILPTTKDLIARRRESLDLFSTARKNVKTAIGHEIASGVIASRNVSNIGRATGLSRFVPNLSNHRDVLSKLGGINREKAIIRANITAVRSAIARSGATPFLTARLAALAGAEKDADALFKSIVAGRKVIKAMEKNLAPLNTTLAKITSDFASVSKSLSLTGRASTLFSIAGARIRFGIDKIKDSPEAKEGLSQAGVLGVSFIASGFLENFSTKLTNDIKSVFDIDDNNNVTLNANFEKLLLQNKRNENLAQAARTAQGGVFIGAQAGAAIGTAIAPGIGTVIGAALGLAVGGLAAGGSSLLSARKDTLPETAALLGRVSTEADRNKVFRSLIRQVGESKKSDVFIGSNGQVTRPVNKDVSQKTRSLLVGGVSKGKDIITGFKNLFESTAKEDVDTVDSLIQEYKRLFNAELKKVKIDGRGSEDVAREIIDNIMKNLTSQLISQGEDPQVAAAFARLFVRLINGGVNTAATEAANDSVKSIDRINKKSNEIRLAFTRISDTFDLLVERIQKSTNQLAINNQSRRESVGLFQQNFGLALGQGSSVPNVDTSAFVQGFLNNLLNNRTNQGDLLNELSGSFGQSDLRNIGNLLTLRNATSDIIERSSRAFAGKESFAKTEDGQEALSRIFGEVLGGIPQFQDEASKNLVKRFKESFDEAIKSDANFFEGGVEEKLTKLIGTFADLGFVGARFGQTIDGARIKLEGLNNAYDNQSVILDKRREINSRALQTGLENINRSRSVGASDAEVIGSLDTLLNSIGNPSRSNAELLNDLSNSIAQNQLDTARVDTKSQFLKGTSKKIPLFESLESLQGKAAESGIKVKEVNRQIELQRETEVQRLTVLNAKFQELTTTINQIISTNIGIGGASRGDRFSGQRAVSILSSQVGGLFGPGGALSGVNNPLDLRRKLGDKLPQVANVVASQFGNNELFRFAGDEATKLFGGRLFPGAANGQSTSDVVNIIRFLSGIAEPDSVTGRQVDLEKFLSLTDEQLKTLYSTQTVEQQQLDTLKSIEGILAQGFGIDLPKQNNINPNPSPQATPANTPPDRVRPRFDSIRAGGISELAEQTKNALANETSSFARELRSALNLLQNKQDKAVRTGGDANINFDANINISGFENINKPLAYAHSTAAMLEKLADSLATGSPTEQALGQKFRKIAKEILASEEARGAIEVGKASQKL